MIIVNEKERNERTIDRQRMKERLTDIIMKE